MTQVPDRVLQWLHNTLKPQYHYVDRTYTDVAQCLTRNSSFSPKTDVHTFDNGSSALLLLLYGTLPTHFRGVEYRYPITLWIPYAYPREAPVAFVNPTHEMVVRPGQHVSADGRIYHPYLAQWANYWDRSNLVNFLQILADVFAKEPPVISRQQQQPHPQHDSTAGDQQSNSHFPSSFAQTAQSLPPPKPPKSAALAEPTSYSPLSPRASQKNALVDGLMEPPALPPKPGITSGKNHQNTDGTQYRRYASRQQNDAQRRGPPLPPLPPNISSPHARRPSYINGLQASQQWTMSQQKRPPSVMTGPTQVRPQQPVTIRPQQPQPAKSPQDLMSAPLEVTLPSQHDNRMIAPPIPPNPEKDALLRAISQALIAQLTRTTSQNYAAIPSLEAQNAAMQQAYRNLSDEVSQLQDLDKMLTSNEKILHETMREADKQLDSVGRKEKPKVDEVLVAPNIVGEQLYGLVADERAIGDTMFALTKALDKGRVGADVYVKQTRSLAREQFLKKALIQKIGSGMGLDAT